MTNQIRVRDQEKAQEVHQHIEGEIYMILREMSGNGHLSILTLLTPTALPALRVGAITALKARTVRLLTVAAAVRPIQTTTVGFRVSLY